MKYDINKKNHPPARSCGAVTFDGICKGFIELWMAKSIIVHSKRSFHGNVRTKYGCRHVPFLSHTYLSIEVIIYILRTRILNTTDH